MSTKCNGCGKNIKNLNYLECCTCKQLYDLVCLQIEPVAFEKLTQDFKNKWLCPECTSSLPKGDNTRTPIRSVTEKLNSTYTASNMSNINMTRGSRHQGRHAEATSDRIVSTPDLNDLMLEIRELRKEIQDLRQRDEEMCLLRQAVTDLKEYLTCNVTELKQKNTIIKNLQSEQSKLHSQLRELESKIDSQNDSVAYNTESYVNREKQANDRIKSTTYASATTSTTTSRSSEENRARYTAVGKSGHNKRVESTAKPEIPTACRTAIAEISVDRTSAPLHDECKMTANNKHKNNNKRQVTRCSGAPSHLLCAANRLKYLHIWGTSPDMTELNVVDFLNSKHPNTLYTAHKLQPKRPQEYSSFKVGIPEEIVEECLNMKFWPKGITVNRWLFRLEESKYNARTADENKRQK